MTDQEHEVVVSTTPARQDSGYWERFRRRFRWVALAILVVILPALAPWPGLHGSTLSGIHLFTDWDIVVTSYLWYLLVVGLPFGLVLAAFPSRGHNAMGR
jgi:hypothetical protein